MTKRPRDSEIQCQLDHVTTRLSDAKKQLSVAERNVRVAKSDQDTLKASVDKIQEDLKRPNLSDQEKAEMTAELEKCVANLPYAENEIQLREEVSRLSSKELELLKEVEQLLLMEKERLNETPVDRDATYMMARLGELHDRLLERGGVMDFPDLGLLFDRDHASVYIRHCYEPLFQELVDSTRKRIIITGTPGTGKSCFLYYLLGRLLALPQPPPYILWEHHSKPTKMWRYDCASEKVRTGTRHIFEKQLEDKQSWYICDGTSPDYNVAARVILITSPNKSITKEMRKLGANVLYMPRWDPVELLACREKVYGDSVPKDLAVQLYERYGGVARFVLGIPSLAPDLALEELTEELTAALDTCSIDQVTSGIGSLEAGPEVSHRVLHLITGYDHRDGQEEQDKKKWFKLSHLDFASRWVADAWVAKKTKDDLAKLERMVWHASGSIRGYMYEHLMHRLLAKGGKFTIQRIDSTAWTRSEPEELPLDAASKTKSFKDSDDLLADGGTHIQSDVYLTPQRINFPTVGAVLRQGESLRLFQMTVSSSGKTLSASALTDVYKRLGVSGPGGAERYKLLELYFVVPPDVYDSFKLRADRSSWPPDEEQQPDAARTRVYVLKGGGAS